MVVVIGPLDPTGWHGVKRFDLDTARAAAKMLYRTTGATGRASIENLSSDDVSLTARLTVGDSTALLRCFRPGDVLAGDAFERALDLHNMAAPADLLPRVLGASKLHQALLQQDITDSTLLEMLEAANVQERSQALGRWFGAYAAATAVINENDTWYDYLLSNYVRDAEQLAEHKRFLQETRIHQLVCGGYKIGLNDFAVRPNGSLLRRIDPPLTRIPDLWELLVSARALLDLNLGDRDAILGSLVSGWRGAHPNSTISRYRLNKLLHIFCNLTPARANLHVRQRMARYTDAFNKRLGATDTPAMASFSTPRFVHSLVDVESHLVDRFRGHLEAVLTAGKQAGSESRDLGSREDAAQKPSALMSAICTACAGNCCRHGLKNHAYLTYEDLKSTRSLQSNSTDQEVVESYISHIPEKHAATGCLFQGEAGCALPRDLRSHTCNAYLCSHAQRVSQQGHFVRVASEPVLIVSINDSHERGFQLFQHGALSDVNDSFRSAFADQNLMKPKSSTDKDQYNASDYN